MTIFYILIRKFQVSFDFLSNSLFVLSFFSIWNHNVVVPFFYRMSLPKVKSSPLAANAVSEGFNLVFDVMSQRGASCDI